MISSLMGTPAALNKGFNIQDVAVGLFGRGRHLHVYSWSDCELKQTLDLGDTGLKPLEVAISVKPFKVQNWILPAMPGLITDFLNLLTNVFCILSTGFTMMSDNIYNIEDPKNPVLAGQINIVTFFAEELPERRTTNDPVELRWEATICQHTGWTILSGTGGERFPHTANQCRHEKGDLKINPDIFVNFGAEPDGPYLAHEMRYLGGDCTSDIWI
ncbi:hypothetical protein V6N13_050508 [Hibiscus sabdariffa]